MIDLRQYKINERMSNYNPMEYSMDIKNSKMAPIAEIIINPGHYTRFDQIDFFFNDYEIGKSIFDRIINGESLVVNMPTYRNNNIWVFSDVKDYRKKFFGEDSDIPDFFKEHYKSIYYHLICEIEVRFKNIAFLNQQEIRDIELEHILE